MKSAACPSCGATVEWPNMVCPHCGRTITAFKNLVGCRVCSNPVAKNANKCPHCGAHTPSKNNFIAGIVAIVLIGIWFMATVISLGVSENAEGSASSTQPNSSASAPASTTPEESGPAVEYIEVTADELWAAYQENQVAADLKYGDKLLAVTGYVTDIGKDIVTEAPCVSLDNGSGYNLYPIQCFFPKNGDQTDLLASLKDGDKVTIYGKCTGEFIASVQLSKCTIEVHNTGE